jgi:dockerin type I repeat protein
VASWHLNNPGFTGAFAYDGAGNIDLNVSAVPPPFTLSNAASRRTHGGAGTFDLLLPFSSPFGVECRSSGVSGNHTLVFTFTNTVVSGSASLARMGSGSVSGLPVFSGNTMTLNLTGVSNAQLVTVTLSGVMDNFSQVLPDTAVSMRVLAGDTDGNGLVDSTDVSQTKAESGAPVTIGNFRADVTVNGAITGSDISLVKLFVGTAVPEPTR